MQFPAYVGAGAAAVMLCLCACREQSSAPPPPDKAAAHVFNDETRIRQQLVQVAMAREPADLILRGATVLNVVTREWMPAQDIVIKGQRIAWVGDEGGWPGQAVEVVDAHGEWAVPGFGESHKHIESTYLTPEYEAALVIPRGNTWTVEDSHEISNVVGEHDVDFWLRAERAGSPLKIFPSIGSATPPTVYEHGGGYYGYREMSAFMESDPRVISLGEVMDWPAVSNPDNGAHQRIWEMIEATRDHDGVIEGHGGGLVAAPEINAFAAAGLSSDHEARLPQEALDKLRRGIFIESRVDLTRELVPLLLKTGLQDWSNLSVTTDDRDVHATLQLGSMDYNIRTAIEAGLAPEIAYQLGSYNTARHFHIEHLVGSISPGRYADVVLLNDPKTVAIKRVYANGKLAGRGGDYLLPIPKIDYPEWALQTINIGRELSAADFRIAAPAGRKDVNVALMEPFWFAPDFITDHLPVQPDGSVVADPARGIIKVAMVDRYHGTAAVSKMFWRGVGPKTPGSALASSQSHDLHNIWAAGNDDAAIALAVNTIAGMHGGWALVSGGKVVAKVRLDIGGLMTARPVQEVAAEMEQLHQAADAMDWIGNPGLPDRMRFAFLTASPWKWQLVAPYEGNAGGFVNVVTGQTHDVLW
ncbi:MAG: Adenine deaminase [Hydrocarboniphaga sp.]|uniref:adenine deaminase n=1 Tax=Hydrocarboniphaga sp. TaxID=2033016 RepID=UPI0026370374|nr:adenine deaminase C-terminal domain-containing protein [Hydrocarboniphaga sp.]MDB5971710.1 Adenine deaminase [Hydrocarboniphaga sp.]